MKRQTNALIVIVSMLLISVMMIAPTGRPQDEAEIEQETEAETESVVVVEVIAEPREIAYKQRRAKKVKLYIDRVETPTEGDTEDENVVVLQTDYSTLVDVNEWSTEIDYIGKTLKGEYNVTKTAFDRMQAAAVVWCILWRVEDTTWNYWPDNVAGVVTQEEQFLGYRPENWIDSELREITIDVLGRYLAWKNGASLEEIGCVLPPEYLWFCGAYGQNWFRNSFDGEFTVWDWSWGNPYGE